MDGVTPIIDTVLQDVENDPDAGLEAIVERAYLALTGEEIDKLTLALYCELVGPMIGREYLYFDAKGSVKTANGLVVGRLDMGLDLSQTRAIINCDAKISKPSPKKTSVPKTCPLPCRKGVEELRDQAAMLRLRESPEQRTPAWYKAREDRLTASDLAGAIGESKYDSKFDVLKKKVTNDVSFTGNFATRWGQKFEQVVVEIYSSRYRENVLEYGMIEHPDIPYLGASPDGIVERSGTMLEIKCPVSRVVDGSVPRHYEIQMQLQLEVCDLELCHFLDCKFEHYRSETEYLSDVAEDGPFHQTVDGSEKGMLIESLDSRGIPIKYAYCPIGSDRTACETWSRTTLADLRRACPCETHQLRYWKLVVFTCTEVWRDRQWFRNVFPKIRSFWHEVTYYRTQPLTRLYDDYGRCRPITEDIAFAANKNTGIPSFVPDSDSEGETQSSARKMSDVKLSDIFVEDSD